jgi:hypothetical protein
LADNYEFPEILTSKVTSFSFVALSLINQFHPLDFPRIFVENWSSAAVVVLLVLQSQWRC